MSRFIKSLLGYDRTTATPEEMEAYRIANEALHIRMLTVVNQSNRCHGAGRPTTDSFGRPI